MKLQLIQPTTGPYRSNSRSGCYVPLGLVSIATFVRSQQPDVEIEILDGEYLSDEELEARVDGDVVGINANTVTYPQALKAAAVARGRGAHVMLGGVYASAIPDLIRLHRKDLIDTIVVGYGERATLACLAGEGAPVMVDYQPPFSHGFPFPDRRLVDLCTYVDRFRAQHPTWPYRGTNIFTNVGCLWRDKSAGGCVFCSRTGESTAFRQPEDVWIEVRELVERFEINYLVDFSDTSLQDPEWFRRLVETKPSDLQPQWHIFARMDEINRDTLRLARRLPCDHIFVGVESGDPGRYRAARKGGGSPAEMLEVARMLRDEGMAITPSYVVGLPGEDEQSLSATLEHAQRLWDITRFEEIFCCPLIPFPGSPAFGKLRQKLNLTSDLYDVDDLKKLWADHFCRVDAAALEAHADRILSLGTYKITIRRTVPRSAFADHLALLPLEKPAEDVYTCV